MRAIAYNKTTKIIIFCIGILASVGLAYFVSVSCLIIAVLSSVGFLAFFGVLVISPVLQKRLYKDKEPSLLSKFSIETFCAQLMTLPIMLLYFLSYHSYRLSQI